MAWLVGGFLVILWLFWRIAERVDKATVRDYVFLGGMRHSGNATWPLAELDMTSSGLRLHLRGRVSRAVFGSWIPAFESSWDHVERVERVRPYLLRGRGIAFVTCDPQSDRAIFWCTSWTYLRVLNALAALGIPTEDGGRVW